MRSSMTASPGFTSVCSRILFDVDVPLVEKKVRLALNARAASSCASFMTPFGLSSESSIGTETEMSDAKRFCPKKL